MYINSMFNMPEEVINELSQPDLDTEFDEVENPIEDYMDVDNSNTFNMDLSFDD